MYNNKFYIMKFIINSILSFILLFIFSCSGEQLELHISNTVMFSGKLYKIDENKPFHGIVYNTYPSGNREYSGEYKNGMPNGSLTYWYDNGKKMREGRLKDGKPVGRWVIYDDMGNVKKYIEN